MGSVALSHICSAAVPCWSVALRPEPSMVFSGPIVTPLTLEAVAVILVPTMAYETGSTVKLQTPPLKIV